MFLAPTNWWNFYVFSPHQVVQPSDAGDGVIAIRWVARVHHKSFDHHRSPHPPSLIASDSACVSTSQLCLRSTFCSSSDERELCFRALKLCVFRRLQKYWIGAALLWKMQPWHWKEIPFISKQYLPDNIDIYKKAMCFCTIWSRYYSFSVTLSKCESCLQESANSS